MIINGDYGRVHVDRDGYIRMIILKLKLAWIMMMMVMMMVDTRVEIEFDWPSARGAWQDARPSELI